MSELDTTLYALFAQSHASGLGLQWFSSETAKWEMVAMMRKALREAASPLDLQAHEQGV